MAKRQRKGVRQGPDTTNFVGGSAFARKFRGDQMRRIEQIRLLAHEQQESEVTHLVGDDQAAREVLLDHSARMRDKLTWPGQTDREACVVDIIVLEWTRREASRYYLNLTRWTLAQFKELQRRFVEAENAMQWAAAILRTIRADAPQMAG